MGMSNAIPCPNCTRFEHFQMAKHSLIRPQAKAHMQKALQVESARLSKLFMPRPLMEARPLGIQTLLDADENRIEHI